MGSKIDRKLWFWQRSTPGIEDMRFAAAGATAGAIGQSAPQRRLTLVDSPEGTVELIQVSRSTPHCFRAHSNADILCIDLHEFGIEQAIKWISDEQTAAVERYSGPAIIAVLANPDYLSVEELSEISKRLEPAGAIFRAWPDGCSSFDQAFDAFGKSVAGNYRWPKFAVEESIS